MLNKARKTKMEKELEKLKAENEALRREQDMAFLLLELTLTAVEQWGKEHGLCSSKQNANQNVPDKGDPISGILKQAGNFSKKDMQDRFSAIFEAFKH